MAKKEKREKERKLTAKESLFVAEYLKDFNGTQAVIRAKYNTKWPDRMASTLLRKVDVAKKIEEARKELEKKAIMRAEEAQQILDMIIRANLKDYYNNVGIPKSITELTAEQTYVLEELTTFASESEGGAKAVLGTSVKLHNKLKALDQKFKILGLYKQTLVHEDPYSKYLAAVLAAKELERQTAPMPIAPRNCAPDHRVKVCSSTGARKEVSPSRMVQSGLTMVSVKGEK
jgi:phage terminase small subunit